MNENRYIPRVESGRAPTVERQPEPLRQDDDEIDLLALLQTIWRGKWIIAAVTMLAIGIGGYYAFAVATPIYTASTTVVLDSREETVTDLTNVVSGLSGNQETLNTEVEVLSSRGLAEELVRRLDLLEDPEFNTTLQPEPAFSVGKAVALVKAPFIWAGLLPAPEVEVLNDRAILDATVDNVLDVTSISNVRQSFVFRITMETTDPEKSARMVDTLAQVYIDDQLAVKFAATEDATEWLTEQVAELRGNLERAEARVKDFNATTTLISPEALEVLYRQLKDVRERTANARDVAEAAREQVARFEAAGVANELSLLGEIAKNPVIDNLLASGAPSQAVRARLAALEARARTEAERAEAQVAALEQSAVELEARIENQSQDLVELRQLEREAEASGTIYAYFLSRLKETSVQQGILQADSRVLSSAVEPRNPSAPKKPLVLALAGMLGLFAGAAIVLGREAAHDTFRTAEDLTAVTGYPVMGTIPKIPARHRGKLLDYVRNKPTSAAAESIRNLRTSIMLSNVDSPPQVILSTSTVPSEGKTTQSILLAQNFAALGKRVLLVEGDMRRRVFASYLSVDIPDGAPSLVTILMGEATLPESVVHDPKLGVDVLVSTSSAANAADLYSSERFRRLVSEMRSTYDMIIIDTPPVGVVSDARLVAGEVDAIVFAVKWDSTHKREVRDGLKAFEAVGIKVSGLVLSQVDPKGMKRYGYGKRGGYYGAYNSYYNS